LDWKTVKKVFRSYGSAEVSARKDWDIVTHIALNKIALRKGYGNYVVVVLDLLSGVILYLLEKWDKEFLINYFRKKDDAFCKGIKVFCSDMWQAYLSCAKELFTNALIVADRFHFFGKCQNGIEHARKFFRRFFPEEELLKNLK
jgi:transposase